MNSFDEAHVYNESNVTNNSLSMNIDENEIEEGAKFTEQERLTMLWRLFDEKQKARYDKYKISSLENRKKVRSIHKVEYPRTKRIVQSVLGENIQVSNQVQNILHGIAKIYAGELVEEAKMILIEQEGLKDKYPSIKPKHLREARRRMIIRGHLPIPKTKNK